MPLLWNFYLEKKKNVWMTLLSRMLHYFTMPWAPLWAPLPLAFLWHGVKMITAQCVWCVHVHVHKGAGREDSPMRNAPLNIANNSQTDYWEKWHSALPEYFLATPSVCGGKPSGPQWIITESARESHQAEDTLSPLSSPHQLYFFQVQTDSKGSTCWRWLDFSFGHSGGSSIMTWHCWSRS